MAVEAVEPRQVRHLPSAAILRPSPIAVPAWRISTRSGRGPICLRNSSASPGNPPSAITTAAAPISTSLAVRACGNPDNRPPSGAAMPLWWQEAADPVALGAAPAIRRAPVRATPLPILPGHPQARRRQREAVPADRAALGECRALVGQPVHRTAASSAIAAASSCIRLPGGLAVDRGQQLAGLSFTSW